MTASENVNQEPFLIILDSLGSLRIQSSNKILDYLQVEWEVQHPGSVGPGFKEMKIIRPRTIRQNDKNDCGLYLICYIEQLFRSPETFISPAAVNCIEWFSHEKVLSKRKHIAEIIKSLAHVSLDSFPKIEFEAPTQVTEPIDSSSVSGSVNTVSASGGKVSKTQLQYENKQTSKESFDLNPFANLPSLKKSKDQPNKKQRKCGLCHETGHVRTRCPMKRI